MSEKELTFGAPSAADREFRCTASTQAAKDRGIKRQKPFKATAEGTVAHMLFQSANNADLSTTSDFNLQDFKGMEFVEGDYKITVTQEMIDNVQKAIDKVNEVLALEVIGKGFQILGKYVEVGLPVFYNPTRNGILDLIYVVQINETTCRLYLFDYKNGRTKRWADDHQFKIYLTNFLEWWDSQNTGLFIETCHSWLLQPKIDHFESIEYGSSYLKEEYAPWAHWQYNALTSNDWDRLTFSPSEEACMFCPLSGQCQPQAEYFNAFLMTLYSDSEVVDSRYLPDEMYCSILKNRKALESFLDKACDVALDRAKAGTKFDGFKLVEARTNRKWTDTNKAEEVLKRYFKREEIYELKVKGPAKFDKALKTLTPRKANTLRAVIEKPKGQPVLAPENDKRSEFNPLQGFKDLTKEGKSC